MLGENGGTRVVWRLTGGRVRPHGCRLYSTIATSGRIYQTVNPPRLYMAWAGLGVKVAFLHRRRPGGMPASFSLSVRRRCCSQVGQDVLRQDAVVLRYAPRVIRIMCAQQSAWFSGEARDVLAHLQLPEAIEKLPIFVNRLPVGSAIDIQLLSMWLLGTLREAFTFTGATS
jgi:hypothetical protein